MKPLDVVYKLVDADIFGSEAGRGVYYTKYATPWEVGIPVYAATAKFIMPAEKADADKLMAQRRKIFPNKLVELCSGSAIHWYAHPIQEWLWSYQHIQYSSPVLFKAIPIGSQNLHPDKGGSDGLVLVKRVKRIQNILSESERVGMLKTLYQTNIAINIIKLMMTTEKGKVYATENKAALNNLRRFRNAVIFYKTSKVYVDDVYHVVGWPFTPDRQCFVNKIIYARKFQITEGVRFSCTIMDCPLHFHSWGTYESLEVLRKHMVFGFGANKAAEVFVNACFQTENDLSKMGISLFEVTDETTKCSV